jgi:hypothetical protein
MPCPECRYGMAIRYYLCLQSGKSLLPAPNMINGHCGGALNALRFTEGCAKRTAIVSIWPMTFDKSVSKKVESESELGCFAFSGKGGLCTKLASSFGATT